MQFTHMLHIFPFFTLASAGFGSSCLCRHSLGLSAMEPVVVEPAAAPAGPAGVPPPPPPPGKEGIPELDTEAGKPAEPPEEEEEQDEQEGEAGSEAGSKGFLRPCRVSLGGCGHPNSYLRKYACVNPKCVPSLVAQTQLNYVICCLCQTLGCKTQPQSLTSGLLLRRPERLGLQRSGKGRQALPSQEQEWCSFSSSTTSSCRPLASWPCSPRLSRRRGGCTRSTGSCTWWCTRSTGSCSCCCGQQEDLEVSS